MAEKSPLAKILIYQGAGFLLLIALTWLDELLALPALILGDHPFIFDFRESALKMLLILAVWFLLIGSTRRTLTRTRYLEGFMRVCAWCHHIDFKSNWISMEDFLQQGFDTPTTHGICPACLAQNQAAIRKARAATANAPAPTTTTPPAPAACD